MIGKYSHLILFGFAIVLTLVVIIYAYWIGDSAIDFNIHDTYFVIAHEHFYSLFVFWFLVCRFEYWILKRLNFKLINGLTMIHLIASVLLLFQLIFPFEMNDVPRRYYQNMTYVDTNFY